jgi:hypothetical protein
VALPISQRLIQDGCYKFHNRIDATKTAIDITNVQRYFARALQNSLPSALLNGATNWHLESRSSNSSLLWVADDVEKREDHRWQNGDNIHPWRTLGMERNVHQGRQCHLNLVGLVANMFPFL